MSARDFGIPTLEHKRFAGHRVAGHATALARALAAVAALARAAQVCAVARLPNHERRSVLIIIIIFVVVGLTVWSSSLSSSSK